LRQDSGWNSHNHRVIRNTTRHNRSRANHAPITQADTFQYLRSRTNPTAVTDRHLTDIHRACTNPFTWYQGVIRIGNIYAWTEHIVIADDHASARIDHNVPIEIVVIAN
jgi:hypothetical protein